MILCKKIKQFFSPPISTARLNAKIDAVENTVDRLLAVVEQSMTMQREMAVWQNAWFERSITTQRELVVSYDTLSRKVDGILQTTEGK
jgi:hypothetical protein